MFRTNQGHIRRLGVPREDQAPETPFPSNLSPFICIMLLQAGKYWLSEPHHKEGMHNHSTFRVPFYPVEGMANVYPAALLRKGTYLHGSSFIQLVHRPLRLDADRVSYIRAPLTWMLVPKLLSLNNLYQSSA